MRLQFEPGFFWMNRSSFSSFPSTNLINIVRSSNNSYFTADNKPHIGKKLCLTPMIHQYNSCDHNKIIRLVTLGNWFSWSDYYSSLVAIEYN